MNKNTVRSKEEQEEREHFRRVVSAFQHYRRDAMERLGRAETSLRRISLEQQRLLKKVGFCSNLRALESCVDLNHVVVSELVADVTSIFENVNNQSQGMEDNDVVEIKVTDLEDIDRVHTTLKQFVRDWSSDGAEERKMCYEPIIKELTSLFKGFNPGDVKVLVPGAGLGRLAFEIAKLGFECQGNEFSLFMLFASNFVLNKCRHVKCFKIYPWVHQFTNNLTAEDMMKDVEFPDVDPGELDENVKFSMTAGDFLEVYSDPEYEGSQDCVVTCFFIDCAHNVIDFIELIYKVLKPGGRWINLGPLLYHFADMQRELSIEPSYDVVKGIIQGVGFTFDREELNVSCSYLQRPTSMLQYRYQCVFFTCTK